MWLKYFGSMQSISLNHNNCDKCYNVNLQIGLIERYLWVNS